MKNFLLGTIVLALLAIPSLGFATNADSLDYHSNVKEAVAIADADSGVCAEVDSNGYLKVNVVGGITVGDIAASTAITSQIPGTAATQMGKAEDAAHTSADTGVEVLGVRNDALAALGGTDGDYAPIQVGAEGAVFVMGDQIEDTAATSGDYAMPILAVRNDTIAALAGTDGDYATLQVDATGYLATSDAAGFAEDAAHTTADEGLFVLGVRNDALAALGGTDGDYSPVQVSAEGALFVIGDQPEDTAAGDGDYAMPVLAVRNDVLAALAGTDGDYATLQVNDIGALFVTGEHVEDAAHASADYGNQVLAVRNDALAALGGTDGDYAPLQVDAAGALYVTVQGTAAGDLTKAEDAAHTSSDVGAAILGVRNDALAALGGTDGDYSPIQVGAEGGVFVMGDQVEDTAAGDGDYALPILAVRNDALAALAGTDGDYATLQVDAEGALFVTNDSVEYAEDAAHTTADEGVQLLAVRNDTLAALAGTDGDYTPLQVNESGALYVTETTEARLVTTVDTADFNAGVDLIAAHGSKKYRVYKITIGSLAAEVTTLTDITPTIMYTAANGVCTFDYGPTGLVQTTAATAITADTADASSSWAIVEYSVEP